MAFVVSTETEVPSDLQKLDVSNGMIGMTVKEVAETLGKNGIGQEAAARRRGIGGDAVMYRHLHLPFPAPSLYVQQAGAIDLALPLRRRFREKLCAQRADDPVRISRVLRHYVERLFSLGHGALAQDLPGEDEIRPLLLHLPSGDLEHQRVAVDAGVHVLPIPVPGRVKHLQVLFRDIEDSQRKPDPSGGGPCLGGAEKRGFKGDTQNVDALFLDDLEGQRTVQASRKKRNTLHFHYVKILISSMVFENFMTG